MGRTRKRAAQAEIEEGQRASQRLRRAEQDLLHPPQDPAEHDERVEQAVHEETEALQAEEIVDELEPESVHPSPEAQPPEGPDRREEMADIARRRAAHFAHYQADEEEEVVNAHTGGSEARRLGPWSSAMELIEARAAAAEARKGRISAKAVDFATEDVSWKPSRDPKLGSRPSKTVDTLFRSCVDLIVQYIDDVETLVGIPEVIKIQLAMELSAQRKMTARVAGLLTEEMADEVVLPNCVAMTEEELLSVLRPAMTYRLERLELRLCGRGFSDTVAAALVKGDLRNLRSLSLGDAYRLSDTGLMHILESSPNLEELHLPQCSRIQGPALESLPSLTPKLRILDLSDCRGLSGIALRKILCEDDGSGKNLQNLEALSLDGIGELNDSLVTEICVSLPKLARLSISMCTEIGDEGVKGIAVGCGPRLTELNMEDVTKITDGALLSLSESCTNLQVIRMRRCFRLTDAGVGAVTSAGQIRVLHADHVHKIGNLTIKALIATCNEKLEEANFSFCRNFSNAALGLLVDSCPNLRKLILFGCTQVGTDFLNGHGSDVLEVIGAPALKVAPPERMQLTLEDVDEE